MTNLHKNDLVKQVNKGTREYGLSTDLFHHAVGEIFSVDGTDMECLGLIFFKGMTSPSELARCNGLPSGAAMGMLDRPA